MSTKREVLTANVYNNMSHITTDIHCKDKHTRTRTGTRAHTEPSYLLGINGHGLNLL